MPQWALRCIYLFKLNFSLDTEFYNSSVSNCLRNFPTVFHTGCTNSHCHQQCTEVPFSPSPGQCLLSLLFLITAIQMSIWRSHLICISLMISDFGHLPVSIQFLPSVIFKGCSYFCSYALLTYFRY